MSAAEITERERRWATPAATLAILAVILVAVWQVILATGFSADGKAEYLREIDGDSGAFVLAFVIRALGAALLAVPLVYLFRAVEARNERARSQLIGLMIAGPLFLAAFAVFEGLSLKDAASDFVARGILGSGDRADDVAQNVLEGAATRDVAAGFGIAGALGFAIAMTYTCYQAMQVGLLTRFWGALGAALGAVSIFFFQFTLLWFIYLGLLIGGWVPKGRPPAWAAGEAVPWPTPGEHAARSLEREQGEAGDEPAAGAGEGEAPEAEDTQPPGERRKRKRRS
ncbi:MAG: hypothetical protein ACRDKV_01625 [Solirubrobacterales bacterium]